MGGPSVRRSVGPSVRRSVSLSVRHTFVKKKVEKLMCLKCVLEPQEPIKKFSRVIFFFTQSVRLLVTRLLWGGLKKFIKYLMCIKCVLGPREPLKKKFTS